MPRSNRLDLLHPLWGDKPSSLRERLEPALQRKGHAFEQTSMDHIWERMPIQNSMKIRDELQSARDLSQTSEEDRRARHRRAGREILRVARIAHERVRRDATAQ